MRLSRRKFLQLAANTTAIPASPKIARALDYPTRPVHLIVGYPAGGPLDTSARLMAQWLSERLGQPFIVENKPGAGSNLATEMVVRARPDGYTLLEVSASNAWCQSAPNFDPVSASNFDPLERRVLAVALAPSELVGVAETARARVVV